MVPIRNLTTLNLRHSRRIDLILAVDYTSVFSEEHAKSAGKRKASDRCGRHYIQNRQSYLYTVDIKYRELANLLTATSPYDGFLHPMKDILGKTYIFRIRLFGDSKEEIIDWANFILENRSNNHLRKREHFDFIVGPVADHRINSIINEEFVLKPFLSLTHRRLVRE